MRDETIKKTYNASEKATTVREALKGNKTFIVLDDSEDKAKALPVIIFQ